MEGFVKMKLLYIYKDYFGRRKIYGNYLEQCGYDVVFLQKKHKSLKNSISVKEIKKYNPDIILFYSPFYIKNNKEVIDYIKSKKIFIILYGQYNPQVPYTEWFDVWNKIDILFVQNIEFNNYLRKLNLNSYYIPFGFHPSQYYKTNLNKKYDISFCGTSCKRDSLKTDKRSIYIRSLKKYNICVFGDSFKGRVGKIIVQSYKKHDEQRIVYGKTKINLDLPFFQNTPVFYKDKYHIKNRFFEVPATGNFLLTARCDEFLNIFGEDTIGYYDDNIESLKENVDKYLQDDKIRKKMAKKAYKLVHEKHTFLHRFKKMNKIIKSII
jgi:spore maturation protein CgeB